jgi:hypothetical protein
MLYKYTVYKNNTLNMETKDIIKELALNILDELETKEEPMKKEVSLAD